MKLALTSSRQVREVDLDDGGEGPALVLIHGGPGLDRRYFRPWFDSLTDARRVVSWDLSRSGERSVDAWSREVFDVMDALSIERADVLGHSFGAAVAISSAVAEPARVRSLVLVSPPSLGPNETQLAHVLSRGTRAQIAAFLGPAATTQDAFDAHFRTMLPLYFANPSSTLAGPLRESSVDFDVFRAGVASLDATDIASRVERAEANTLVCVGAHDWLSDAQVAAGWTRRLRHSTTHVFSRSAHFPFMEEPELFLGVLERFLGDQGFASPQQRKPSS